jgi:hypothetical protein
MSCARGQQKNKQTLSIPHEINLKVPGKDGTQMHSLSKIENLPIVILIKTFFFLQNL